MSFLLGRILGGSAARTVETRAVATGSSGLLTKVAIGGVGLSLASPLLGGLSQIPGVGTVFQPASQLANSGLGALNGGVNAVGGAATGIGDILSNPIYLLGIGGVVLLVMLKK